MKKRVIGYFNNWITVEDVKKKCEGYTDILFSFWVSPSEISGAAEAVEEDPEIIEFLKGNNKKCILAAGGDTMNPINYSASDYGIQLANYAIEMGYDGVNLDIEHIPMDTAGIAWLTEVTMAVKSLSIIREYELEISHAPQATYFKNRDGYSEVERRTQGIIAYYNIQYYNQGTWGYQEYETYETMFEKEFNDNGQILQNATAIPSIIDQGIPGEKLIVGKPITYNDAYNTGYIPVENLQSILEKANNDSSFTYGGVMGWKIDSDIDGAWGKTMSETLAPQAVKL
ncbi:glycoside hydrolase family 18 protein [Aquimarina rhabdastrellae]